MPDKNLSRDPGRTSMQWDGSTNAGFTTAVPWLRIDKSFDRNNVLSEKEDPYSMLSLFRRLIALRQTEPALNAGNYETVFADNQLLAFKRELDGKCFMVCLNLSHRPCYFKANNFQLKGKVEVSTSPQDEGMIITDTINLSGDEGIIVRLY